MENEKDNECRYGLNSTMQKRGSINSDNHDVIGEGYKAKKEDNHHGVTQPRTEH